MIKGKTVKDTWEGFKLKNKASLLLMGTTSEAPKAPEKKITFVEDLDDAGAVAASNLPPGLVNLGNTCYMNATVQCLHTVPELNQALTQRQTTGAGAGTLAQPLGMLFNALNTATNSNTLQTAVMVFLTALRQQNPRFAEQREGRPAQQDASECWGELVRSLDVALPGDAAGAAQSFMRQYFGIQQRESLKCAEAPEEAAAVSTTDHFQLSCHIDKDVSYVMTGLVKALKEEITKASPTLGRDALYIKEAALTRLPAYLTVNFVRFYFKRSTQENCKIRKDVKFPMRLDVFDLCADDLKEKLRPMREKFAAYQDWEAEQQASGAGKLTVEKDKKKDVETHPVSFENDPGSSNSGYYELRAVLTHKGRSSDSGHYVAWVKTDEGKWALLDDDTVTERKEEEVLALSGSGGADWHTAYILLYGPAKCPVIPGNDGAAAAASSMDTTADTAEATS